MEKPFLLTYEYPPQIGGIGKYLEQEVKTFSGNVCVAKAQNFEWKIWPNWLPQVWNSRKIMKKEKCDYLWISHILPCGYVALALKKIFGIEYRIYVHGLDIVRPLKSSWKKFWIKKILLNSKEIIANSNATSKVLKNYDIEDEVIQKKLNIIYPKIEKQDPEQYRNSAQKIIENYGLGDKKVLLTIARLVKRKGVDLVISAAKEIEEKNLVYAIIGDGDELENLKQKAGNDERILFLGKVEDKEKYAWLCLCDIFILTPIESEDDFEGYGIVYKEAQMFNKPVIGSLVGGVPEAIGNNGILVEAGNINQIKEAILTKIK